MVDARDEQVRVGKRVVSQGVLSVTGVRADGYREILAVDVADTEREATYDDVFRGLKQRGLSGVQLVTSDDHQGLKQAVRRHYQGASWQRCQEQFTRNLMRRVEMKYVKALGNDLT